MTCTSEKCYVDASFLPLSHSAAAKQCSEIGRIYLVDCSLLFYAKTAFCIHTTQPAMKFHATINTLSIKTLEK